MNATGGYGVVVDNPTTASNNYFYHLQAAGGTNAGGFHVYNANTSIAGKNLIFGYDQGNGEPDPSAEDSNGGSFDPTLVLFWIDSMGQDHGS